MTADEDAAAFLAEESMGFLYAAALRAVAVIGVADHLAGGPRTPAELAESTGTDASYLHRALRLLATRGVFREDEEGRFQLTPRADALRADSPSSVRAGVLMTTSELHWRSAGELAAALEKGTPAFDGVFGMPYFDYLAQDAAAATVFHQGMANVSQRDAPLAAAGYDFPESGVMVDVGGGRGGLLLEVLRSHPGLRGMLFDRDEALAGHHLRELGADDRWELVPGDFFDAVPSGGDLYVLQNVLHDWTDAQCVRILRNCHRVMAAEARMIVIDRVIPPGDDPHRAKTLDVLMMGVLPGRTRTAAEFGQLFAEAGLRLTRVIPTPGTASILEAVPA